MRKIIFLFSLFRIISIHGYDVHCLYCVLSSHGLRWDGVRCILPTDFVTSITAANSLTLVKGRAANVALYPSGGGG